MSIPRPGISLPLLFLGLLSLVLASACLGSMPIPVQDVLGILASPPWANGADQSGQAEVQNVIVWDVRLPRILTAAAVGAGLAAS
ncbi:MAG: iron chelate uptake ABC transporter family permease subunit, partial [Desulfovermiculus sp.]